MNTEKNIRCIEREEAITLAVCGELEPDAIAELDSHLAKCLGCAEAFAAEQKLHESYLLNAGAEPSQAMLAECRAGLDVALDRASQAGASLQVHAATGSLAPPRPRRVDGAARPASTKARSITSTCRCGTSTRSRKTRPTRVAR